MKLEKERQLPWPRERVWSALNDPELLQLCIPGCTSMSLIDTDKYEALVTTKIGPVKANFRGHVSIMHTNPPKSYTLRFEGQGGAAGFANGEADIALAELDDGDCAVVYCARATVGGKLAQIGSRLVQGAANKMADQFFANLIEHLNEGPSDVPGVGSSS